MTMTPVEPMTAEGRDALRLLTDCLDGRIHTSRVAPAVNEAQAETWAKRHLSDLDDEVQDVFAQPTVLANVPKESRGSLPWVAGSLADEDEITVEQWLQKTGQV